MKRWMLLFYLSTELLWTKQGNTFSHCGVLNSELYTENLCQVSNICVSKCLKHSQGQHQQTQTAVISHILYMLMTFLSFCSSLCGYSVSCCLQWLTYYWTLLPRLLLVALCLLSLLIVIPASELPPDYRWFPADNWTVNEIWWTDGASPWGQLPCPLWPRDMGVEVGPDTLLLRHTQKFHPFCKFIVMLQKRATVSALARHRAATFI